MVETWYDTGHCIQIVWVDSTIQSRRDAFHKELLTGATNLIGKGKRIIMAHIGSNAGFVNNVHYVYYALNQKPTV